MDGDKCQQPGCGGVIELGFCNRCGLEPPVKSGTSTVALAHGSAVMTHASGRTAASATLGSSAAGRTGSGGSRRGSGSIRSTSRKHLGLGLVTVPGLPPIDPEKVVMANPVVPDHKRFCANPECHDKDGNLTALNRRLQGHCPNCGAYYSFVPTLKSGDIVAEQYEVKGCLAFGGLGWIYLAKDTSLNRWVVLKGLLNSADESAAAAAVAERQFLASVKHANIVGIYNFVKRGNEGFIVMEYVGGTTVKEIRKSRGPLPPAEAISYVHRILGAFSYLHDRNLVYCDFKPDNFMVEGEPPDVKLIDMGGVRMIDDLAGDIFGTRGYNAPEAGEGPSIVSDLYTIGRTLAVLLMEFRFQSVYETKLPTPDEQPVLDEHESLYRFLLKATDAQADRRFQTADEMSDQLGGVLREVVAGTVDPKPVDSLLFGGDPLALHGDSADLANIHSINFRPNAALLPDLKVDPEDPGAQMILSLAAVTDLSRRSTMMRNGVRHQPDSAELKLRLADALVRQQDHLKLGQDEFAVQQKDLRTAEKLIAEVLAKDPYDWRVLWYRGIAELIQKRPGEAMEFFDAVYTELPGEPAVKLAVAIAAEAANEDAAAIRLYDLVSRTDPAFVSASIGLGRCLARTGRGAESAAAYRRVAHTSGLYTRAQMSLAQSLICLKPTSPGAEELCEAAAVLESLGLVGRESARLRIEVFDNALQLLLAKKVSADPTRVLMGAKLSENAIRKGLEYALRDMAQHESLRDVQIELVDRANSVRPRTWI